MTRLIGSLVVVMIVFSLSVVPTVLSVRAQETPPLPNPLELMPVEVKIGQLIVAGVTDVTDLTDDSRHVINDLHIGNIILMGRNVDSPDQVLKLTQELQALATTANGVPLLIGTDQEGGLVQRLNYYGGFTLMPPAALAGAAQSPELMREYGRIVGAEMNAVGVNLAFAPVLDVNDNPTNPVIGELGRSFGTTPALVEESAPPFIDGLHDSGVAATGKHFPGHGSTTSDSHLSLPYVDKDRAALDAVDIAPFRAAVDAGIDAVMPTHVVYQALDPSGMPATISEPIQTGLLRGELDFDGVIVTDDLGMQGIMEIALPAESGVRAILAGADILTCVRMTTTGSCQPEMIDDLHAGLVTAVQDGRISMERLDQSVRRILALKEKYRVGPATGEGLDAIQGAAHQRAVADLLEAAAERTEEEGRP